jgi:tRNA A-37 threonylcarbamoyl transferase component Bud32|nr:serine/threonine-protein kinase [Kofleriaceae bacterium]
MRAGKSACTGVAVAMVVAVGIATARPAAADKIAVPDAHGEADVADEAFGVTLLVRGALSRDAGTLVAADQHVSLDGAAAAAGTLGADRVVVVEVSRDGTGLRATMAIVSATGAMELAYVRAGDGDIGGLAAGVVDRVVAATKVHASPVPAMSLGRLRAYAEASRKHGDTRASAALLEDAAPATAVIVPAARAAFIGDVRAIAVDRSISPATLALAAFAVGATSYLDTQAAGTDATAAGARALAAIARLDMEKAQAAVATQSPSNPVVAFAQAMLAEHRADDAKLDALLMMGLAGEHARAFAALASTITPARLSAATHRALLALAERPGADAGVASRIGAAAAEAFAAGEAGAGMAVERDRALALIDMRDLDSDEIARVEPLLVGATPVMLRLRAELAMRRADADAGAAIAAFVAGAPKDPRAQRYLGWLLAAQDKWGEAADAFAKAMALAGATAPGLGLAADLVRARLGAGDARGAADAGAAGSPEVIAAQARVALDAGKLDDAAKLIATATAAAAIDPVVERVALAVATARHDDARAAIAKRVVEIGAPAAPAHGVGPEPGTGSATPATVAPDSSSNDEVARVLGAMLAQLPLARVHRVAVGELRPKSSFLRVTHGDLVLPSLLAALAAAGVQATVVASGAGAGSASASADGSAATYATGRLPNSFVVDDTTTASIDAARGDADALLVYRADAASSVQLVLYRVNAPAADETTGEVALPGLVTWNVIRIAELAAGVLVLGIALLLGRSARSTGSLEVTVSGAPDATDAIYCLEVSTSSSRPAIGDPGRFHNEARRLGPLTDKRSRTHVGKSTTFRLSAGRWHVHLYGAFERGGTMRAVPDSASKDIEVRRGRTAAVAFDLAPTLAEVQVHVQGAGKGATVRTTERDRVHLSPDGRATLSLPIGMHVLTVEHGGVVYRRDVRVPAARVQRITIDLAAGEVADAASVALGSEPAVPLDMPPPVDPTESVKIAFATPQSQSGQIRKPTNPPAFAGASSGEIDLVTEPRLSRAPTPRDSLAGRVPTPRRLRSPGTSVGGVSSSGAERSPADRSPAAVRIADLRAQIDVELDAAPAAALADQITPPPVTPTPPVVDLPPLLERTDSKPDVKVPLECKVGEKFLGRYSVVAELGRGAMGIVHRARDEKLERDVAIKEMSDELRQYPEAMQLFRKEAKALAQLNHTNIVAMYDQVDDGDHVWMIMEYVDGRTLESILDERIALPWVEAVSIIDQVCSGLAFAHARGVIHRDVKPGNVFVSSDRIVKLGDFGLAHVERKVANRRTEVRGTPLYMAPEQIKGDEVDARTDLYAVGCTLFEMTSGRPPFIDGDILYKQVHEAPPTPTSVGAQIPKNLESLIMRLIQKDAGARLATANAVRNAFKDIL